MSLTDISEKSVVPSFSLVALLSNLGACVQFGLGCRPRVLNTVVSEVDRCVDACFVHRTSKSLFTSQC